MAHMVSVVSTQACYYSTKTSRGYINEWVRLCANITLFTETGNLLDWVQGHSLQAPVITENNSVQSTGRMYSVKNSSIHVDKTM